MSVNGNGSDQVPRDTRTAVVAAKSSADHATHDTQTAAVGGNLNGDHVPPDTQTSSVAAELLFFSALLDDIEQVRKATANRIGALEREGVGTLPIYQQQLESLEQIEHQAVLALQRAMRKHPLGPWVKRTVGIGEKQAARLIAAIGDLTIRAAQYDRETGEMTEPARPRRGPAELWAYCGYRPDQKRRKGVQSNWNADAKMRAHLAAEAAIKAGIRKADGCDDTDGYDVAHRVPVTPYGARYLTARRSWADRDVSDLHKHNHALRCVAKAILKDMWREAVQTCR